LYDDDDDDDDDDGKCMMLVELPATNASMEVGSSISNGQHGSAKDCRTDATDWQLHSSSEF